MTNAAAIETVESSTGYRVEDEVAGISRKHGLDETALKKLNLGCWLDVKKGWVNVDFSKENGAQVAHDLDKTPYPFKANSFDFVYMSHALEHLSDPVNAMKEVWRVLKPRGFAIIRVPHYAGNANWMYFTHKRGFGYQTLLQLASVEWCKSYSMKPFSRIEDAKLRFWKKWYYPWNYLMEPLANLKPVYYENTLANVFPPFEIVSVLQK